MRRRLVSMRRDLAIPDHGSSRICVDNLDRERSSVDNVAADFQVCVDNRRHRPRWGEPAPRHRADAVEANPSVASGYARAGG